MIGPLLTRVTVLVFGAIQGLLTLRLLLPYVDLAALQEWRPTIVAVSDMFIDPFRSFAGMLGADIPSGIRGPLGGGFGDRLDPAVIVALVGWSLVELVILAILRIFTRADGA